MYNNVQKPGGIDDNEEDKTAIELHPTNCDTNAETSSKYPASSFTIVRDTERIDEGPGIATDNTGNTGTGAEPNPIGKYSKEIRPVTKIAKGVHIAEICYKAY